jgi:hypothetical protein
MSACGAAVSGEVVTDRQDYWKQTGPYKPILSSSFQHSYLI